MKQLQNLFTDHILMAWVCDHVILTPGKYRQLIGRGNLWNGCTLQEQSLLMFDLV